MSDTCQATSHSPGGIVCAAFVRYQFVPPIWPAVHHPHGSSQQRLMMQRIILELVLLLAACLPRASSFFAKSFSTKPAATHGSRSTSTVRMLQAAPAPESDAEDNRRRKQKASELAKSVAIPTASSEIPFAVPRSLTKAVLQVSGPGQRRRQGKVLVDVVVPERIRV